MLSKRDLTLQKTIEILRTSQATQFQDRDMAAEQDGIVKSVKIANKNTIVLVLYIDSPIDVNHTHKSITEGHQTKSFLTT